MVLKKKKKERKKKQTLDFKKQSRDFPGGPVVKTPGT